MEELSALIQRARAGKLDAYGEVVLRFQDMAYGCAYAVLGDFHLAEDAAQEAFIEAYRHLGQLREPAAFAGWFRRIVFKHCDRIIRRRRAVATLDAAGAVASANAGPAEVAEQREMQETVLGAIRSLPEHQRMVTTLFYINGYTQREVADFLEVPLTTVKKRLSDSRQKLKERMMTMVADELKKHPLGPEFPEHIRRLIELPRPLDIEKHPVRQLWGAFRACFADAEVVELDEVCPSSLSLLLDPAMKRFVYTIDERRMLRPELTSQLLAHWVETGGGARTLITCGRVFRADHHPTETHLRVFHQCELFSAREAPMTLTDLDALVERAAAALLPGHEFLPDGPCPYPPVSEGRYYGSLWQGREHHMAGGGVFKEEWLRKGGLDPKGCGAIGFSFGLERTAQIRHDLDDVRKLWEPPYVSKE